MAKVTVKIHGGLGNQMFQYAFGRALSLKNDDDFRVDPATLYDILRYKKIAPRNYALSTVFNIDPKLNAMAALQKAVRIPYLSKAVNRYYPRLFGRLGAWRYIKEENDYAFDPNIYGAQGNIYLDGYWQTEKYFKEYESEIRKDFTFRAPFDGKKEILANEIRNANAVCLNVRRQEVIKNPELRAMYYVASPEYYEAAIALLKEKIGTDVYFFIISDDIDWCRNNMKIDGTHTFIGDEYYGIEFRDALHLMTLCKHFIIPNSSFAWWAAWLSKNKEKIVIAPKKWNNDPAVVSRDILPEGWIGL